ncbi:pyruvate dehydrogenase complex dihydrolipoamide acetyltransferase [Faunimonas sp. B44]|uniref:pyruvate dehydrogenase complex dihydrolipoamide acetyltransferase n=1 Tax=Faunimonas sp. B44 TaxID=3461493 RepID=UPI004044B15A
MPINILMPALSPTMEKGNLAKWLVKEGDKVSSGDVIAEIETDKATMEVEAVDEGTVARIVVPEGTADVPVNEVIALLAGEDEDASSAAAPQAKRAEAPGEAPAPTASGTPAETAKAPEPAKVAEAPRPAAAAAAPVARKGNGDGRIFASPLARRLAAENGIDLAAVSGSGPHGRVIQRDIEQAIAGGAAGAGKPAAAAQAQPAPAAAPAGPSDEQIRKLFAEGSYELVPHDSMRKTIARRLAEAKATIPHYYLTVDCEIDALLKMRAEMNAGAPTRKTDKGEEPLYKLSVNDFVIKALAMALMAVPDGNVTWTGEGMLKHKHADIAVAVALPGGLITPVIRSADQKTLSAISNEMKDLAKRARDRKLKPEEYQGGATAVSNLGMFGIRDFSAVINPPQSSILAIGVSEERPVVRKGEVVVRNIMTVTISCDHRAMDGALGAELIAAFKRYIESPIAMLA